MCACAPALPSPYVEDEEEVSKALAKVVSTANETRELARKTELQVQSSERLLEEARSLLQRAEAAEAVCKESERKIAEVKKKKIIRRPRRPVTPVPPVTVPPPIKEPVKQWPEHSPSDAP